MAQEHWVLHAWLSTVSFLRSKYCFHTCTFVTCSTDTTRVFHFIPRVSRAKLAPLLVSMIPAAFPTSSPVPKFAHPAVLTVLTSCPSRRLPAAQAAPAMKEIAFQAEARAGPTPFSCPRASRHVTVSIPPHSLAKPYLTSPYSGNPTTNNQGRACAHAGPCQRNPRPRTRRQSSHPRTPWSPSRALQEKR